MNDEINLKELEQKTFNEFMIDGITEFFAGLILLFSPLLILNPIFVVFVPFLLFLSPQAIEYIRQRTTYPRIGRVEFKEQEKIENYSMKTSLRDVLILLLVAVILTFTFMMVFEGKILDISLWYSWVPFMFGLIMFGPSLFLVEKTGQRYYYVFGIFSSILGLGISTLDFPNIFDGMYLYFFTLGLLVLALGVIRYIWFIRNYPVIVLEED
ncbi:hypothetical protein CEE45_13030 [Candidatus Heimdallarchaeota archaeon B3_Heim]|nr:MAG: hypothetical protein CEE45_13030 [Candidatus Heimdallarchaeota archaeon B3_Heim]